MNRTRVIRIVLVLVAVLGLLGFTISRGGEPRYQNRTLTEWLRDVEPPLSYREIVLPRDKEIIAQFNASWQTSSNAVKQIGTNAVPYLLKWVKDSDSPLRENLSAWLDEHPLLHFKVKSANECYGLAMTGFGILGSDAKPAWPALIQWTSSPDFYLRYFAFTCLSKSRPDEATFLPVLLRLIHDPDRNIQEAAARVLHNRFPKDAETAGVYKTFPELKNQPTAQSEAFILDFR